MKEHEIAQADQVAPPRCILVVEDEPDIRLLCAVGLEKAGYCVETANDGAAGWDALQAKHYDLLITDNSMPKITGLELLEKIHAARISLPVIMATGTVPTETFARNPWLQPAATLHKPHTFLDLLVKVKEILGN